jgi:hypothetical protein
MPIDEHQWKAQLIDRYRVPWMVNYEAPVQPPATVVEAPAKLLVEAVRKNKLVAPIQSRKSAKAWLPAHRAG